MMCYVHSLILPVIFPLVSYFHTCMEYDYKHKIQLLLQFAVFSE